MMPTKGPLVVTTSWDDGHVLDHKLAQLLDRHQLPGTFYVAPHNVELDQADRLDNVGVAHLAQRFEIGGHTMRHIRLTQLSDREAREDIIAGREYLQDLTGQDVSAFCYVGGCFEPRHEPMVSNAGFRIARTVRRFSDVPGPAMRTDTTVNAYRHLVDMPRILSLTGRRVRLSRRLFFAWDDLAIWLFDRLLETGGVFHLWGHSWEVDARGDWRRLERVLAHIGGRTDVVYATNSELPVLEAAAPSVESRT